MSIDHRGTPCIGICSTTYGDLVCRGCRRFAHEIVSWNAYSDAQRDRVWERLRSLEDSATAAFVEIVDADRLRAAAARLGIIVRGAPVAGRSPHTLAFELLRRAARVVADLESIGLRARRAGLEDPRRLREAIDLELHARSVAAYEHSFHVVVDR